MLCQKNNKKIIFSFMHVCKSLTLNDLAHEMKKKVQLLHNMQQLEVSTSTLSYLVKIESNKKRIFKRCVQYLETAL